MNKHVSALSVLALLGIMVFEGCSKTVNLQTQIPFSYYSTDMEQAPYYGDTILRVMGESRQAYLFAPVRSVGAGHFVSWPEGLSVDPATGVIDASASEPGARYNVGFVSDRTRDTAYSEVVLAGVSYQNSLYVRGSADSVLAPYYNAILFATAPADFYTGSVDGSIDLNTLTQEQPANGTVRQVSVRYRMTDKPGQGVQTTTVMVYYYDSYADVPSSLLQAVTTPTAPLPVIEDGGTKPAVAPAPAPAPSSPRPPQIVIVNKGH